jgi:thioester reductase-like protein
MTILLTGVTGLVGAHAALALLRAGHRIVAVSRPKNAVPAEARVRRVLSSYPDFAHQIHDFSKLVVVEGDVTAPECALARDTRDMLVGQVDTVIHCAGEVRYDLPPSATAYAANIGGVRQIAGLAHALHARHFIHIGTAYIDRGLHGGAFRTPYERSKYDGEQALAAETAARGLRTSIVRPSIVTGDQHYGFTPTYNGIYPFLRYAALYRDEVRRADPVYWLAKGFTINGRVNLIPADHLALVLSTLVAAPPDEMQVYPVVNPTPWPVIDLLHIVFEFFDIKIHALEHAGAARADMSPTAALAAEMLLSTYAPYLNADLDVDAGTTTRFMKAHGIPPVVNRPEWIHALLRWCIRQGWREIG